MKRDGFGGPLGAHVSPGVGAAEDHRQFFHSDIADEVVLSRNGDSQGIGADAELNRIAADFGARFALAVLDEALLMSVSPSTQKRSKPAPEPMEAIDGGTPPASVHSSAAFAQREDGGAAGGDDFAGGVVERHLGQPM